MLSIRFPSAFAWVDAPGSYAAPSSRSTAGDICAAS